jgi:antitoxin component YwqK of YwqJK toxin-antitoxin module
MKQLLTILFLSILIFNVSAQSIKKEYYDPYYKTKTMAKYQVNSVGEKHGWFKGYDQQGVLVYEYNYSNGLWNGINKEYSVYGGRKLAQTETYKDGVLNGPAVYYFDGVLVKEDGSYKDGKMHGEWIVMQPFDSYGFSDEIKKGSKYVKKTYFYEMGEKTYPDGEIKAYFHPSNKVYSVENYENGKYSGNQVWYNPDGAIKAEQYYATAGDIAAKKQKELNVVDSALISFDKRDFEKAEQLFKSISYWDYSKAMGYLALAKNLFNQKKYKDVMTNIHLAYSKMDDSRIIDYHNEVYVFYIEDLDKIITKYSDSLDPESIILELKNQDNMVSDKDLARYDLIIESTNNSIQEITDMEKSVSLNDENYTKRNVVQKATILVDENGKPVMKDSYPIGEFLYLKSRVVIDQYKADFLNENDFKKKLQLGVKFNSALEVLNEIPESEWKGLNKQLKKIDDPEQIKSILKI